MQPSRQCSSRYRLWNIIRLDRIIASWRTHLCRSSGRCFAKSREHSPQSEYEPASPSSSIMQLVLETLAAFSLPSFPALLLSMSQLSMTSSTLPGINWSKADRLSRRHLVDGVVVVSDWRTHGCLMGRGWRKKSHTLSSPSGVASAEWGSDGKGREEEASWEESITPLLGRRHRRYCTAKMTVQCESVAQLCQCQVSV